MSRLEEWAQQRLHIVGRSGDELIAECPWCSKPKLYLNTEKRKFICYRGCAAGSAISLVAQVDDVHFSDAEDRIYDATDDDVLDLIAGLGTRDYADVETFVHDLPEGFQPCFDGEFWRVPAYASTDPPHGRGLDDAALARHGIGYVSKGAFTKWRGRLIVPVVFGGNRTFVARLMGPPSRFAWTTKEGETVFPHRYLYPKGADVSRLLYWGDNIPEGADLIVVEGAFDAIRLIGLGFHAVATFGKELSKAQARFITEMNPRRVTVLYDEDARGDGIRAALKLRNRFDESFYATVESDPDELGFFGGRRAIDQALAKRSRPSSELDALALDLENIRA